ncbi:MAG: response regulator [Acidobacteria bacterium]|nr:response regulator [Acidobacteriota bacterium]
MPRILVVDDEPALLRLLETFLSRVGHHVTCCGTGGAGLLALDSSESGFDIAVLDHWLPDMTGMELLDGVLLRAPGMPVLISSGSLMEIGSLQLPETARIAFLPKPYVPKMLCDQIDLLLAHP